MLAKHPARVSVFASKAACRHSGRNTKVTTVNKVTTHLHICRGGAWSVLQSKVAVNHLAHLI